MNIRKNMDYTDMYEALDSAMEKNLSQVELYYEIGRAVCQRTEKGAAVAAAAYLSEQYPNIQGFSPRNLRRMRDFCHTYEDHPDLLTLALQLGWTQNVVILEGDLSIELREWYMKAAKQFGWSKIKLIEDIKNEVHKEIVLDIGQNLCDNKVNRNVGNNFGEDRGVIVNVFYVYVFQLIRKKILIFRCRGKPERLFYVLCKRCEWGTGQYR